MLPNTVLTIIFLSPLLGSLLFLLSSRKVWVRLVSVFVPAWTFLWSAGLFLDFKPAVAGYQFQQKMLLWDFGNHLTLSYHVGVDGFSLLLVGMSSFVFAFASYFAYNKFETRQREFFTYLFVLETGVLGVFLSLNLVLFYISWEVMVFPMVFLVGIWGGAERIRASVKYLLFSFSGSILMLTSILSLYYYSGTSEITDLMASAGSIGNETVQLLLLIGFFAAFAIKVPLIPLHTWMPDLHAEAPNNGVVDAAAIMLKVGIYGFFRIAFPLFAPIASAYSGVWWTLGLIGIIYGAIVAMGQKDSKRLVAYSSLSHMGFCLLGLASLNQEGVTGGMLQLVNHGFTASFMFLLVSMLYDRFQTTEIGAIRGISQKVRWLSVAFLISALASVGLPGTNGFVGEFLVILGNLNTNVWIGILAATGMILAAAYMLPFVKTLLFGKFEGPGNDVSDLDFRESVVSVAFIVMIFWLGLYPNAFLKYLHAPAQKYLDSYEKAVYQDSIQENGGEL